MEPLRLTVRQTECVRLAGRGLTDRQIAEKLQTSRASVSATLLNVYKKIGVSNRHDALHALLTGYTPDARPLHIPGQARFSPDGPADEQVLVGGDGAEKAFRRWRKPPRGVLNRAGIVLGLTLIWILLFAGAVPAVLHLFDRVQGWWANA